MDPISDMLNRIKNAQMVSHDMVVLPFSKVKFNIAEILKTNGFIKDAKSKGRQTKKAILITLKYNDEKEPAMTGFKKVSKPGQKIYKKSKEIRKIRNGFGIAIISTSKGIMLGQEARKKKLGGELMLEIW